MIQVAIDTSMLVGLLDAKDIWHLKSLPLKNFLIKMDAQIASFDRDFDKVGWLKRLASPDDLKQ